MISIATNPSKRSDARAAYENYSNGRQRNMIQQLISEECPPRYMHKVINQGLYLLGYHL